MLLIPLLDDWLKGRICGPQLSHTKLCFPLLSGVWIYSPTSVVEL